MTKIQWTDETWNPIRGCSRVSAGCTNCYAEKQASRFSGEGMPYHGLAEDGRWTGVIRAIPEKLSQPLRWTRPRRVFVNSMSDLFHEELAYEEIDRIFAVMALSSRHTFQVLTKRPEGMLAYVKSRRFFEINEAAREITGKEVAVLPTQAHGMVSGGWPIPNVWLGVSVEDQATADERVPLLLRTPAAVRFVSAEPLLGPVDVSAFAFNRRMAVKAAMQTPACLNRDQADSVVPRPVDWIIVGGESGPGARPCDISWIRNIVLQCSEADTAVFVKQLGTRPYDPRPDDQVFQNEARVLSRPGHLSSPGLICELTDRKGGDPSEWPDELRVREFPAHLANEIGE